MRVKGLQNMGRELEMLGKEEELELKVEEKKENEEVLDVFVDSSAAKGFASKRGVGKISHMEVKRLWLQEEVRRGRVKVAKVLGTQNPPDLLTKFIRRVEIEDRLGRMNWGVEWAEEKKKKEVSGVRRSKGGE